MLTNKSIETTFEVSDCAFVKNDGIGKFKVDAAGGKTKVEIGKDGIAYCFSKENNAKRHAKTRPE